MPFEQTKPGQYDRPFDGLELFHQAMGAKGASFQREHWYMGSAIKLRNKPEVEDLKQAWKALRHLHPRIATVTDETGTLCRYNVPNVENLEQWLEETFTVHAENEPNATSAEDLHRLHPVSPLFTLHWLPASQELLFRASHWRTDAAGVMKLQHAYLSILSSPPKDIVFDGSEVSRLTPTVTELIVPDFKETEETNKALQDELQLTLNGPEIAWIKETSPAVEPGTTIRTIRTFSQEDTTKIIAGVKKSGLKFTAAIQAALQVTASRHVTPVNGRLFFLNAFNLRKYLPAPWNGADGAGGLYHTGRLHTLNLENASDYKSISENMNSFYAEGIEHTFSYAPLLHKAFIPILARPAEVANVGFGTATAAVSPYGVVDDHLQTSYEGSRYTLGVNDWWCSAHIVEKLLSATMWTRDGHLHLNLHYNKAFYEHGFVEDFIEEWRSVVAEQFVH